MRGKIKWFDRKKGYGFIVGENNGKDIFFSANDCIDDPDLLENGDLVHFVFGQDSRGPRAVDVLKADFEIGIFLNKE